MYICVPKYFAIKIEDILTKNGFNKLGYFHFKNLKILHKDGFIQKQYVSGDETQRIITEKFIKHKLSPINHHPSFVERKTIKCKTLQPEGDVVEAEVHLVIEEERGGTSLYEREQYILNVISICASRANNGELSVNAIKEFEKHKKNISKKGWKRGYS